MSRFIILIGGPSKFLGCDKEHDQTWNNFIVPMQLAGQRNLYARGTDEQIVWLVHEPSYQFRWSDDSVIDATEQKQDDGYWLHSNRKKAADTVVSEKGATNYINRIKMIANSVKASYQGISKPDDFWNYIKSCPTGSISRVWYCGHASGLGLMLALGHDPICRASSKTVDMILAENIIKYSSLQNRFQTHTTKSSKFYGCYTRAFALAWNQVFGVPTEGATNKIDFSTINGNSNIPDILKRIEQTPTSKGNPDWNSFK